MAKRELVDFQLYRKNGVAVGERISTSLDTSNPDDIATFFGEVIHRDWDTKSPRPEDYRLQVWRHGSDEVILTYPT
ncbi:hypothetical protein BZB76_1846 [Actinomadura pelletieri DSM 43383]|uniref:Uncharacterized protein n=1 Tax=Actinomadura pelletieri DSM 43383 TaxID=1120940 RepID=A0A495QSK8_9ACTN|nr:hypothetical protein [Actinomadura pelletieri]RKS76490.1 hypothetical protein BZB76_1846 [Actinomadura pelletieri DSM 43383]